MSQRPPQRVTRGYALALIAADAILAIALLVAGWGALSLWLDRSPVTSEVSRAAGPLIVLAAVAVLVVALWYQTLEILRGSKPAWALLIVVPGAAYLVWSLGGFAAGMGFDETWFSPFALLLALIWAIALGLFWAVFMRRVYTDRGVPKWPWERNNEDDADEFGEGEEGRSETR